MIIRFDKKWFNPLYFILNEILKIDNIRTILIYGGKSSSKTASVAQLLMKEMVINKFSSISFRKESSTVPTTLDKSFNLARNTMYLYPVVDRLDRLYRYTQNKYNRPEIALKGIDDEEKAKGVEGYKYIYLDELNHFTLGEYTMFQLSLRGMLGQKLFASWNPVDENSWVKTDLVDKYEFIDTKWKLPCENSFVKISTCGKVVLIKTTYEDNFWINGSPDGSYGFRDENLIAEYKALAFTNANSYRVNVLGEWGKTVFGGEFLKQWKSEVHTGFYPYNPNLAIYLEFDENVNPYFPCGIFQVGENQKDIFLIYAMAKKNPENTVSAMCREITRKLHEWGHKETVFVGGDPTSDKEDVKQEKGHDLFRLIMNELREFNPRRAVSKSSPSVLTSKEFFNSILENEIQGLKFRADIKCRVAILDYENTKEDKNGKVDKRTINDPKTKVPYQPWGHFVDLTRYFLCHTFPDEYAKFQRGNRVSAPIVGKNISRNSYT